jgi:peptidoglycan L-alanyl-D-glutamate endopeptidase CwlK
MILNSYRLVGVHPDLVNVIQHVVGLFPFNTTIIEGARSEGAQALNLKAGKSRTKRSRHVRANNKNGYACAVDMAPLLPDGTIPWNQWDAFKALDTAMKLTAKNLGVRIEWGGDWKTFKDGDHWQLPWATYP